MRNAELIASLDNFLLETLPNKKVAVLTHWGGDADSIGASYVLMNIMRGHYKAERVSLTIPDTISAHSKAILDKLSLEISDLNTPDVFILVDVGSLEQLGSYLEAIMQSSSPIALIDHHLNKHARSDKIRYFTSDEYQSTSEIIYDLAMHIGWEFNEPEAKALFMGIYYDTARLSVADTESFSKVCRLISGKTSPSDILIGLETRMDESERIARLKASKRMNLYRIGDWIIATSNVSAFQTSAARAILGLGAHVAVVAGEDEEGMTSISLRAQPDFVRNTLINMGQLLVGEICERFGGTGGGHATVARVKCKANIDDVLSFIIKRLSHHIGSEVKQVS